jgi:hypothetical protein
MEQAGYLNDKCKGGSGDEDKTWDYCKKRDKVGADLQKKGWCWGPLSSYGYQKKWIKCDNTGEEFYPAHNNESLDLKEAQKNYYCLIIFNIYAFVTWSRDSGLKQLTKDSVLDMGSTSPVKLDVRKRIADKIYLSPDFAKFHNPEIALDAFDSCMR